MSREVTINACVKGAVRFGGDVPLSKLGAFLFNEFAIVATHDELRSACKRMGYFVTSVMRRRRDVEVVRWTEKTQRARKGLEAFVGMDISEPIMNALDEIMKPGEIRTTREAYSLLKAKVSDLKDTTSTKITRSLEQHRYRVTTRTIGGVTARYIERVSGESQLANDPSAPIHQYAAQQAATV